MSVSAGVPSTRRTLPVATLASVRAQTSALLREHRRALLTVVGLHALAAAAGLAAPYVVGRLVDEVTGGTAYATVDRLAARAWPTVPIDLPVLSRLHGDPVTRAIPHPQLPSVPNRDGSAAPDFSLAALRNRRQVVLLLTHGGACLACLGYAKQVLAEAGELLESSSVPVIIGRGEAWISMLGLVSRISKMRLVPEAAFCVTDTMRLIESSRR